MSGQSLASIGLRDIHAAPMPDFWPPAPGWWLLVVLGLVLLFWLVMRLLKIRRKQQLKRQMLAELDRLIACKPTDRVTQVSTLLRRIALMYFKRSEVAPLSGSAWLAFLDRTGGNGAFSNGVGNLLASVPYAVQDTSLADSDALLSLARNWISHNVEKYA